MPLSLQLVTPPAAEPVSTVLAKSQCRVDPGFSADDQLFAVYITAARQMIEKLTNRAIFNQTWIRTLDHFPLWWSANGTVNPNYRNDWPYYSDYWNRIAIDIPFPRTVAVNSISYTDVNGIVRTLQQSFSYTDLAIGAIATQLSSAANPFTQAAVGKSIVIAGGTGFTPGTYVVESVAGVIATLSAACGAANSTAGTGSILGDYVVDLTSTPARIVPAQGTYWPSQMTYVPGSVVISFVAGSYGDGNAVNNCPMTIVQAMLLLVEHWWNNRGAGGMQMQDIPFGVTALIQGEVITATAYRPL